VKVANYLINLFNFMLLFYFKAIFDLI